MGKMEGGEEMMVMNEEESIVVSVRLRPLNDKEISKNDVSDWECINDTTVFYKNANLSASERSMYPSAYTFDRVFRTNCSTRQVYEEGARQVALSAVSGINATVFAYGQTSSGKTYTMSGITEYTIGDIYDYIQKHGEREYILKFSAMEIYNECVRDLLSTDTSPLRLLDDPERGTVVEKLTEETLRDWDHVMELLSFCQDQRQIGETALNETSSRSHQIIRLTIESSAREFLGRDNFSTLTASVNFVDLAGSERASQSLSAGARLKEGCHINRSLLTLGTVIRKLSKGKNGHIPFRDSKLTRILQSSLAGNARIAVICTMSPARTHVEQSRNTLLFASCAKEVTTNAQVNVVMSEKALVKHLQRELSRLESQLHSPRATIVTADYSAIIRDKDRQIEQLEKEVKDLILQRDIAQAQAKDLLKLLGGDNSPLMRVGLGQYPNLRIHESPADSRRFSYGHSRSSSECNSIRIPESDNLSNHDTFPRVCVGTSSFSESESFQAWGEMERRSNASSEDICKEVRCIEQEEEEEAVESQSKDGDSESTKHPVLPMEEEEEEEQQQQQQNHQESEEDHNNKMDSPSLKDHEKELHCVDSHFKNFLEECENFKLTRSRSCDASVFTDRTPPNGSEREFTARPDQAVEQRKPLMFHLDAEKWSSTDSHPSPETILDVEFEGGARENSPENQCDDSNTEEPHVENDQVPETPTKEPAEIAMKPSKSTRDVGLDPIEDEDEDEHEHEHEKELRGLTNWPTEFKRLQKEIIELWHTCNVSLVHRTYFFLLFQGDPTDAIYMEVELRRMVFLKDIFARGEKTIVNGHIVTLASSIKALRHERLMLSKQMARKMSEQEREELFLKWGIGLDSRRRRLQLAHRLWSYTADMNHVSESAYVVAKLVGFIENDQHTPKEMFGLNFTPRNSSRNYSFKRSLISLL